MVPVLSSRDLQAAAIPYLTTPAACLTAWPITAAMHGMWEGSPWAAVGITVTGAGVTALTWAAARPRGQLRQRLATLTAGAGSAWTLGATISAPWVSPWLDMWMLGSLGLSVSYAAARVLYRGGGGDESTSHGGQLGHAVAALRDATIGRAITKGATVSARVSVPQGDTLAEVEGARDQIASALDVRPDAVRVRRDPESVRKGTLEIVPVDQLAANLPWEGPQYIGESVAIPLTIGISEDGERVPLHVTGEPGVRPATHVLVSGMTGSGKTNFAWCAWVDYLTRADGRLLLVDTVKRGQSAGPIKSSSAIIIDDDAGADALLTALAERVIPMRTDALGRVGLTEWVPGCGLTHLLVWVEESAAWSQHPDMVAIAERARTAGVTLVLSQQRWTHDRAPTSLRAQLATKIAFGLDGRDDPSIVLSDGTVDSGACPERWGASRPGYYYIEAPGVDEATWCMPRRVMAASRDALTEAVRLYAHSHPLDEVTSRALHGVIGDTHEATPTPEAVAVDPLAALVEGDPPDTVDPSQPIAIPTTRIPLSLPEAMDPSRARSTLRSHIARMWDSGARELRPADLGDVLAETGLTAQWLSKVLAEMCSCKTLARSDRRGVYRIAPPLAG